MQILSPDNKPVTPDQVKDLPDVPAAGQMCATNGCSGRACVGGGGFCTECSATEKLPFCETPAPVAEVECDFVAAQTAPTSAATARPSIDVALDSHRSISDRLLGFIARMRSWDLRKLAPEAALKFTAALGDLEVAWADVRIQLEALQSLGFVAKTTPLSRLKAVLAPGKPVRLAQEQLEVFSAMYNPQELESLVVVKVGAHHAFLRAKSSGRELGAVDLRLIELVE